MFRERNFRVEAVGGHQIPGKKNEGIETSLTEER